MALTPKGTTGSQLDLTRYVHFIFIGGGAIATYLAYRIIDNVWLRFSPDASFPLLAALGVAVGGGLAFYLWRHERTNQLAREVVGELSRVAWPTKQELSASTVVVIVASIIAAVILGLFDAFWSWLTGVIY